MPYLNKKLEWLLESGLSDANYWETLVNDRVRCHLCPRNCVVNSGGFGFCKARYNEEGKLKSAISNKMLMPSIEPIETEAVFHYRPGAKILSVGNLGCNLECDFCQNWESSNLENLDSQFVFYHTPEEIVNLSKTLGIEIISFTYNDPVVWFEFVYETARLARENGLKTLFKSAGFMSKQVAQSLTEVIDIFSISLKSSNAETFKQMSRGILDPVLDAIKIFHNSSSYLELSNLIVTNLTDIEKEVRELSKWVKEELSEDVPLHFVRFHPAYKYNHVPRTPIDFLEKARDIAHEEGLKYVYIGNTYQDGHADIYCEDCGNIIVKRFGLYTDLQGISSEGNCKSCGKNQHIELQPQQENSELENKLPVKEYSVWKWDNFDARNLHIQIHNNSDSEALLICEHLDSNGMIIDNEVLSIPANCAVRMAVGQKVEEEKEVRILHSDSITCYITELQDRAHFPLEGVG